MEHMEAPAQREGRDLASRIVRATSDRKRTDVTVRPFTAASPATIQTLKIWLKRDAAGDDSYWFFLKLPLHYTQLKSTMTQE